MITFKRFIKAFYIYIFTIDEDIKKSHKKLSRKDHIKYRVLLILVLLPILYAIFVAYREYGFTLIGTFKLLLLLLIIRFLGNEHIDAILATFIYKSSYQISEKERRKLKLKKIKRRFL